MRDMGLSFMFIVFGALWLASGASAAHAAGSLRVVAEECNNAAVDVDLDWQPGAGVTQQWLDVSAADNGWQPGSFTSNGPLAAPLTSTWLRDLAGHSTYFIRQNELRLDGTWEPSQTLVLATQICASATSLASVGVTAPDVSLAVTNRPADDFTQPPAGTLQYSLSIGGPNVHAVQQLMVSLSGPGGAVASQPLSTGGWSWFLASTNVMGLWFSLDMPAGGYKVTVSLPGGASATTILNVYEDQG